MYTNRFKEKRRLFTKHRNTGDINVVHPPGMRAKNGNVLAGGSEGKTQKKLFSKLPVGV